MERWKNIPGYEGLYEASSKGQIRSKKGKTTYTERHGERVWKSRILKEKDKKGRETRYDLWKNGKSKTFLGHRLIAQTFIPNLENKPCVNHIDGNPKNNHIENLEWCTYKENEIHSLENGLSGTAITIILVDKISGEKQSFHSMSRASRFIGFNNGYISGLLKRGKNETEKYIIEVN